LAGGGTLALVSILAPVMMAALEAQLSRRALLSRMASKGRVSGF